MLYQLSYVRRVAQPTIRGCLEPPASEPSAQRFQRLPERLRVLEHWPVEVTEALHALVHGAHREGRRIERTGELFLEGYRRFS